MTKGEVCNRFLMEGTSGGQSVNDWTTGTQSENVLYHRWVHCNYSLLLLWLWFENITASWVLTYKKDLKQQNSCTMS